MRLQLGAERSNVGRKQRVVDNDAGVARKLVDASLDVVAARVARGRKQLGVQLFGPNNCARVCVCASGGRQQRARGAAPSAPQCTGLLGVLRIVQTAKVFGAGFGWHS